MKRRQAPRIIVDVMVSPAWRRRVTNCSNVARKAAQAAIGGVPVDRRLRKRALEVSIVLTGDAAIRKLNATYRGKNTATNVLAFPAAGADSPGIPVLLGDVVVAYGTASREAWQESKSLKNHLSHLVVHGVLHLLGYDHQRPGDAKIMEKHEIKILSGLGIPTPTPTPGREGPLNRPDE